MRVLIIQEKGRHKENENFREGLSLKRAFEHHGQVAEVWGLNYDNYEVVPDWESYHLIINLENYDETGWVPNLSHVKTKKFLWSIDAHVKGLQPYLKTANEGNYDLILQATKDFVGQGSVWFPNCYDDDLIKPLDLDKIHDVGFCGNTVNRANMIEVMKLNFQDFKFDEFVIGHGMVEAICGYKVHWNANIGNDINYRNFETMGCRTALVTSQNPYYAELGFKDGENCIIYDSMQTMVMKTEFLLSDPERLKSISERGYELVSSSHTYKNRAETIIKEFTL